MTETFREFWETSEYSNILTDSKRMPKEIVSCLELLRGPIEPPTKDITEIDETETSASEHMDVDEVEMHLMQPEEDDIATAMSPEIQEITREAFMLHPVTWEDPESPLQSIKSSKTPSTPKFTPTHISTPPRPQKNTEPSPIPSMPFFVLGPSTPLLSTFPQTPKRSSPKHRPKSGPASNKENRSPTPIPTAASATSEREILARSPGQGVLGKRRSLESIEEEEDMLQKRAQGETSGAKKSRLMKVLQESLELPPSDDDPIVPSPIKALLAKPEVLHASTESKEEVSPPKSKKRKGMFMEAVELPRRFVRRRTESLPEPSTTSHSSSEDTTVPEAPTAPLRRTRSVTRLLGKAAKFERLIHTPKKKARRSLDANLGSERSTGSATLIEAGSSSPLRGLREAMVPGSGGYFVRPFFD